jgi:hypothetical protein
MSYDKARKALIAKGFRPYRFPGKPACLGMEQICSRFPETIDCYGTGRAQCEFLFVNKDETAGIEVTTVGEGPIPSVDSLRRLDAVEVYEATVD